MKFFRRPQRERNRISYRSIQADDVALLQEMHSRVSPQSLVLRYLQPRVPTRRELEAICTLQPQKGAAWVAVVSRPRPMIVGIGYYVMDRCGKAEVAFLVEDDYQGRGIGRTLLQKLLASSRQRGLKALNAYVCTTNSAMMQLFRTSGCALAVARGYDAYEVNLSLVSPMQAVATIAPNADFIASRLEGVF